MTEDEQDESEPPAPPPGSGANSPFTIKLPTLGLDSILGQNWSNTLSNIERMSALAAPPPLLIDVPTNIMGIGAQQLLARTWRLTDPIGPIIGATQLHGINVALAAAIEPTRNIITELVSTLLGSLPSIEDLQRQVSPPNLLDADVELDLDQLKSIMLDEGLPLAWVPRPQIVKAVLLAPSPAARRTVYGRRWVSLVDDCEQALNAMSSAEFAPYVSFALKSVSGLRDGHYELAQAFAANTLDTLLQQEIPGELRLTITGKKLPDMEAYNVRQFFAFSQIWGIHRGFYPSKGDPVPGSFNRHGSVHGVSRRQYSRINSIIGLVHLTSFMCYLDLKYSRG